MLKQNNELYVNRLSDSNCLGSISLNQASGCAQSCFTANALPNLETGGTYNSESTVKNVAAMMYLAGTDATASVLATFILAMIANPAVQSKAQLEIDAVVVLENLPDFSHRHELPYVAAIVKEVLRWGNAGPLGWLSIAL